MTSPTSNNMTRTTSVFGWSDELNLLDRHNCSQKMLRMEPVDNVASIGDCAMPSKNGRRGVSEIGSLLERLKAVEQGDLFAPVASVVPSARTKPVAARTRGLVECFGLGFASACVGGGVTLLMMVFAYPANARVNTPSPLAPSNISMHAGVPPVWGGYKLPEARRLWWKLPLSADTFTAERQVARAE
jgi:hypothetical protein